MRLISERSYRGRNLYIRNIAGSRLISNRELSIRRRGKKKKEKKKNRSAFYRPAFPSYFNQS